MARCVGTAKKDVSDIIEAKLNIEWVAGVIKPNEPTWPLWESRF